MTWFALWSMQSILYHFVLTPVRRREFSEIKIHFFQSNVPFMLNYSSAAFIVFLAITTNHCQYHHLHHHTIIFIIIIIIISITTTNTTTIIIGFDWDIFVIRKWIVLPSWSRARWLNENLFNRLPDTLNFPISQFFTECLFIYYHSDTMDCVPLTSKQ